MGERAHAGPRAAAHLLTVRLPFLFPALLGELHLLGERAQDVLLLLIELELVSPFPARGRGQGRGMGAGRAHGA